MKQLFFTIVMMISLSSYSQVYFSNSYPNNDLTKKEQKEKDSLCSVRGHAFDLPKINFRSPFISSTSGTLNLSNYYSDTSYRIVDDKDSSYIMGDIQSSYKYCYRCQKNIEFKVPSFYYKTIWKKE